MNRTFTSPQKSKTEKKAIYVLIDAVAEAIREYDKSDDHLKHEPGADCVRCKLEATIGNTFVGKPVKPRIV